MRALTLWPFYSALVATGAKKIETRGWKQKKMPRVIAIHAAASQPQHATNLMQHEPFASALAGEPMHPGCIVAVVEIGEIISTKEWLRRAFLKRPVSAQTEREYIFGDYGPDRFAWQLLNVRRLPKPIPCKGGQRLWNIPEEIAQQIDVQLASLLQTV
jgi:hypothetical protein